MKKFHKKLRGDSPGTFCRILSSATELFAAKGFRKTNIREIAVGAKCNIASVNYYFHGKIQLYQEIFKNQIQQVVCFMKSAPSKEDKKHFNTLERDLQAATTTLLSFCVDQNHPTLFMNLIYQEMIDPHLPKDVFMQELFDPINKYLHALFCTNLPGLCHDSADLCVFSFAGQLLHLINLHHFFSMSDRPQSVVFDPEQAIRHIIEFSAAGAVHLSIKDQCQFIINSIDVI